MNELLLFQPDTLIPETGDVLFLYDPETNSDLTGNGAVSTLFNGMVLSDAYLIDGLKTLYKPTSAARQTIAFPTPIPLSGNWTLEWEEYNTVATAAGSYANGLVIDSSSASRYLYTRYGDTGWSSRYFLGDPIGSANPNRTWPTPNTKASLNATLNRWAMVYRNGNVALYLNGVRQVLALGNSSTAYQYLAMSTSSLIDIAQLRFGSAAQGSVVGAVVGYQGRIRLSNFGRYTGNYTPQPLTL